jgi:hypothetical protein
MRMPAHSILSGGKGRDLARMIFACQPAFLWLDSYGGQPAGWYIVFQMQKNAFF